MLVLRIHAFFFPSALLRVVFRQEVIDYNLTFFSVKNFIPTLGCDFPIEGGGADGICFVFLSRGLVVTCVTLERRRR